MKSIPQVPPLHRKYNPSNLQQAVFNRYKILEGTIDEQVALLQNCNEFNELCQMLYSRGYKDWSLISIIANQMFTLWCWKNKLDIIKHIQAQEDAIQTMKETIAGLVFPCELFTGDNFHAQLGTHLATVLPGLGFTLRKRVFITSDLELFLRSRLNFFDYDIPHDNIFGNPKGSWPQLK